MKIMGIMVMNKQLVVKCPECSDEHLTSEVEFINIEEDIQGWDVFYFVCPVTNNETSSFVYGR